MSTFMDLERKRAAKASCIIAEVRNDTAIRSEYGSLARSAAVDVMTNGLGQTLAFWKAKAKGSKTNAHGRIRIDLSDWILPLKEKHFPAAEPAAEGKPVQPRAAVGDLLDWVISDGVSMAEYRWATREAVAFLTWLKRFAEAELSKEALKHLEKQGTQAAQEEEHDAPAATQ